jgi:hypothetical protein
MWQMAWAFEFLPLLVWPVPSAKAFFCAFGCQPSFDTTAVDKQPIENTIRPAPSTEDTFPSVFFCPALQTAARSAADMIAECLRGAVSLFSFIF